MSKVLSRMGHRSFGHIVLTENNKLYYVDSAFTPDHGYETMVFRAKRLPSGKFDVVNWLDLYCELYDDVESMKIKHDYIIHNLEEFIEEEE